MFHPRGPSFRELVRQALSSTREGYDLLAPKFEYTPFSTPDAVLATVAEVLAESGPVDRILDLCCGTGRASRAFLPLCSRQLVGLDFSPGMLAEASRRTETPSSGAEVTWVQQDARALDFDSQFDLVVSFGALGHFLNREIPALLQGVHRALKPGGRFFFVTTEKPSPRSLAFWMSHGFNAAMRMRNLLISPPFIMYYLTFLLPAILFELRRVGFHTEVRRNLFPGPYQALQLVIATHAGAGVDRACEKG